MKVLKLTVQFALLHRSNAVPDMDTILHFFDHLTTPSGQKWLATYPLVHVDIQKVTISTTILYFFQRVLSCSF